MNIKFLNSEKFLQGIIALQEDMNFKVSDNADFSVTYEEADSDILSVSLHTYCKQR